MTLDDLLPHRPPFRFVLRVLAHDEHGGVCLGRFPCDAPVAGGGSVPALLGVELAAQAAALLAAFAARGPTAAAADPAAPARPGVLVSLRDIVFHRATLPAGIALWAEVRRVGAAGGLTLATFRVGPPPPGDPGANDTLVARRLDEPRQGEVWVEGTIGTYLGG